MSKILERLGKDTIVEAIFEMRFSSNIESVADFLPGLLFQNLRERFPQSVRLPAADIPFHIRQKDPNLHYVPQHKLIGDGYNLSIGERVFSISCQRPYTGWQKEFKGVLLDLINKVQSTNVIDNVERFSLKYVNILPSEKDFDLNMMDINLCAGKYDLSSARPTHIRTEIIEGSFLNIIQISSGALAEISKGKTIRGTLLDIDTIKQGPFSDFWSDATDLLEAAHTVEKNLFTSFVSDETLESLEPTYKEV